MPRISDPLELLTQQHDELLGLLATLASSNEAARAGALADLAEALPDHLAAEQELLYPIIGADLPATVHEELVAEHVEIKRALADLLWLGLDDAETPRRIAALRRLIEGHVAYQEEQLFESAAETLAPIDITVLGSRLSAWFLPTVAQAA